MTGVVVFSKRKKNEMGEQLVLLAPACRHRGCDRPIVGSSIRGEGHVCREHNVGEWADGLARSRDSYWRAVGLEMRAAAVAGNQEEES